MALQAYHNLPEKKRELVFRVCKEEFQEHPFAEASVSNIVKRLKIARGSFYCYFENLESCYFYILEQETAEIHDLFFQLLQEKDFNFLACLEEYPELLVKNLIESPNYDLYRKRFLYWSAGLEADWQEYKRKSARTEAKEVADKDSHHPGELMGDFERQGKTGGMAGIMSGKHPLEIKGTRISGEDLPEFMHYLKAVVHDLVCRLFRENWTAAEFRAHYRRQLEWLLKGIKTP